jgi:serine/threonine-protein kinase HipA
MNRCLICHESISGAGEYHAACVKRLFGQDSVPLLDITGDEIEKLAAEAVRRSVTVPGVQPKLSLHLDGSGNGSRMTIVGLWGGFVLKPPVAEYPHLPENEALVMRLADMAGIETVPHGLIRLASGEYAYITRRVDRDGGGKLHMEDFCQLSGRLTHEKYQGSLESASKVIARYASNPGFDMVRLFSLAVFSFVVGNADMHLKNYSLLRKPDGITSLAPAYDLVSTALAMPQDTEDTALAINGKKHQLARNDFLAFARYLNIPDKTAVHEMNRFGSWYAEAIPVVEASFLPVADRRRMRSIIDQRCRRLELV